MVADKKRTMKYLSVCSGIEAATVAWHDMGWTPVAFSEIEKFPSQVLNHHYPSVPNLGDMTNYKEWDIGTINLLVGGTPCQSFSVAGLRKGLADPRGNLALVYCGILDYFRPKWFVWENVPGVLSSNGGRDFGSFLGALAQLGYGFAYRVLDAQFFGVAQRRRRVFVVGHLGDWRRAASVLFEPKSLRRDIAPSRETGKNIADGVGKCLTARGAGGGNCDPETANMIPTAITYEWHNQDSRITPSEVASTLSCNAGGREGNLVQPIPLNTQVITRHNALGRGTGFGMGEEGEPAYTISAAHSHAVAQPIAYSIAPGAGASKEDIYVTPTDTARTLDASVNNIGNHQGGTAVMQSMAVRRLTPIECERLQGFPDDYTNIKENCPDGPRYKALGNSMAVPVMKWIGQRIQAVEEI